MAKDRDNSIDIAKGLGIIFMVWAHAVCPLRQEIFLFHVPMFFFLSGLFFNPKYRFKDFLRKRLTSLILPFVIFEVIWAVVGYLVYAYDTGYYNPMDYVGTLHSINDIDGPIWFLLSLFEVSIVFYLVEKYGRRMWVKVLMAIVITATGYWLSIEQMYLPLDLSQAALGYAFYAIGYGMRKADLLHSLHRPWVLPVLVAGYALGIVLNIDTNLFRIQVDRSYVLSLIPALSGSLLVVYIAQYLQRLRHIGWLTYTGRKSLMILCIHYPLMYLLTPTVIDLLRNTGATRKEILISPIYGLILATLGVTLSLAIGKLKIMINDK